MNESNNFPRRLRTEFGPETRFEIRPAPAVPFRGERETAFERLKAALLAERLEAAWNAESNSLVRRAANEAAALAWVTPYPLLTFPVLFEEKVEAARIRAERQLVIRERSRELLAA